MLAARLPEPLGVPVRGLALVECGGTTGALALKTALQDLRLGHVDVAVVAAGSKTAAGGLQGDPGIFSDRIISSQGSMMGPWVLPYATGSAVPFYAMATQRYMIEYGVTGEEIARVPVVLRRNAADNPMAQFRDPITVQDVLIAAPIERLCVDFLDLPGGLVLHQFLPDREA
jgi:acetyl-CoA C-acetyltransferase